MAPSPDPAELPALCKQFNLPDAFRRIENIDARPLLDRATANFRRARSSYLQVHKEVHGTDRDFACTYTQKTHDQIQGQISSVYADMLTIQAILYSFLELAFERIDQLEGSTCGLIYCGVWTNREYVKGSVVTHSGCCWHANQSTTARPGTDPEKWTLMVKRGRDGKDAG